jgi:hypothetical protein
MQTLGKPNVRISCRKLAYWFGRNLVTVHIGGRQKVG